jgi:hypothetical protein
LDDIENQRPGGLSSLYEVSLTGCLPDAGVNFQPAGQVLEAVAEAREPLTRKQIAAVTGLEVEKELPSHSPACQHSYRSGRGAIRSLIIRCLGGYRLGCSAGGSAASEAHDNFAVAEGIRNAIVEVWAADTTEK